MMKAQGRPESIKHASEQVRPNKDEVRHGGTFQEETTSNLVLYGRGRKTGRWKGRMTDENVEEERGHCLRRPRVKRTPTGPGGAVGGGESGCAGSGEGRGEGKCAQGELLGFRSLSYGCSPREYPRVGIPYPSHDVRALV